MFWKAREGSREEAILNGMGGWHHCVIRTRNQPFDFVTRGRGRGSKTPVSRIHQSIDADHRYQGEMQFREAAPCPGRVCEPPCPADVTFAS